MADDGVNDAPALAATEVGIAMGNGTDIALESSGIILVKGGRWAKLMDGRNGHTWGTGVSPVARFGGRDAPRYPIDGDQLY